MYVLDKQDPYVCMTLVLLDYGERNCVGKKKKKTSDCSWRLLMTNFKDNEIFVFKSNSRRPTGSEKK